MLLAERTARPELQKSTIGYAWMCLPHIAFIGSVKTSENPDFVISSDWNVILSAQTFKRKIRRYNGIGSIIASSSWSQHSGLRALQDPAEPHRVEWPVPHIRHVRRELFRAPRMNNGESQFVQKYGGIQEPCDLKALVV